MSEVLEISRQQEKLKIIPWIDMREFLEGSPDQKMAAAIKFGESLQKIGFVAATNIGINPKTVDSAYEIAEKYFSQSEEIKLKQRAVDGRRGFIPFGTEHAKYTSIMDLKEFFHTSGPTQPEDLWPNLASFKEVMLDLYLQLENSMKNCLRATAIYLGYANANEQNVISDLLVSGESIMRILHYPPVDPAVILPGSLRSAAHEDLGIMTIIPRATGPGLQVLRLDGEWLDVVVPDGAAIINAGDILARMTNGIIPSTTHRVINPPVNDLSHRYSIPFFGNFKPETVVTVLEKCRGNTPKELLPKDITFGAFLQERYEKIGLKDKE